jgi:hypothetical protein
VAKIGEGRGRESSIYGTGEYIDPELLKIKIISPIIYGYQYKSTLNLIII